MVTLLIDGVRRFFVRSEPFESALCSVFSRALVSEVRKTTDRRDVLDALVEKTSASRTQILERVAHMMGMRSDERLSIPDAALIGRTGFDVETLRQRAILPQYSTNTASGYSLVVADPSVLDLTAFRLGGIEVVLGSHRQIRHAWRVWDVIKETQPSLDLLADDVRTVLKQIVSDCSRLGATEVFLGHPSNRCYEGLADGRRFSGVVHGRVFDETMNAVRTSGHFSLDSDPIARVSITRNFERSIICMTWQTQRTPRRILPAPERSSFAEQLEQLLPADERISTRPTGKARATILVVEDDDQFASGICQILKGRGYDVCRARNGEEGLKLVGHRSQSIDLIISDVHMPTLDGRGFLEGVRKSVKTPVIILTSDDDSVVEADLVLLGANAYLRKNDDPRVLLAWTENLVAKRCLEA